MLASSMHALPPISASLKPHLRTPKAGPSQVVGGDGSPSSNKEKASGGDQRTFGLGD